MKSATAWAAGYLAFGFGVVSFIMLGIEPAMGFVKPADYFDPVKLAAGYASKAWLVSTLLYLTFPIPLFVLARSSSGKHVSHFGLAAAAVGLLLATLDLVGTQLSSLLPGEEQVRVAAAAMVPIRFAVLKATCVLLGLFAWGTTRAAPGHGMATRAWRGFGWFVLAVSLAFLFVFVPVPVAFFLWAVGLTVACTRQQGEASGSPRGADVAVERSAQPVG